MKITILVLTIIFTLYFLIPPLHVPTVSYSTEILDYRSQRLRFYTTPDGYWRLPLNFEDIDPRFVQLLLVYEDKRFYQHPGVDVFASLRAIAQAIMHGRLVSGASTISMQTVRLLQPRPRTLISKCIELLHAIILETRFTKQQILTLYLTLAPYGGNIQGLRAASWFYFGKEPNFLTLAESALLIALPQAPETRRPDKIQNTRTYTARDFVLQRLVANKFITQNDASQASVEAIPHQRCATPRLAPHFTDRIYAINPNVQSIRTTINARLQKQLEKILANRQQQQTAGITIAAIVVDNKTWAVRAYAGSADYFARQFSGQINMARAIRSPGSTLKPFIYGLAFDAGIAHPETLIFDRPGAINGYAPGNFDHNYQGEISVRTALQTSRNIPAIKILNRLGTNTLVQRFTTANINLQFPQSTIQPGLPLALGGVGLRLEDLARLYVSLANGGIIKELRVLETAPLNQTSNFILSQTAAWYLTDILAESQPPAGFTVNRRQIAFKTGTSYGFRDAWAIGYDTLHTVAVWLGRPDNGYTANLSGLQSAAPIMLEIFAHLPKAGSFPRYAWERATLLQTPPSNVLITERDLPSKLRHFDYPTPFAQLTIPPQNKLTILYPPTGAVIAANDTAMKVHIEISGGKAPFHILENGKPIKTANDRQTLDWIPTTNGRVHLTVLDTNGHADRIQLNIEP